MCVCVCVCVCVCIIYISGLAAAECRHRIHLLIFLCMCIHTYIYICTHIRSCGCWMHLLIFICILYNICILYTYIYIYVYQVLRLLNAPTAFLHTLAAITGHDVISGMPMIVGLSWLYIRSLLTLLHTSDDPDSASRSSFASLPALGLSNKPMVEGGTTSAPELSATTLGTECVPNVYLMCT